MSKAKKRARSITKLSKEKDIPVLGFIWRWKVVTTNAVTLRFYQDFKWSYSTVHFRLWRLWKKGFIKIISNEERSGGAWALTKNGFDSIRWTLPETLKEEGFGSEHIKHDLLVMAAHLGDWIWTYPKNVSFITEQHLRRYPRGELPCCIPDPGSHGHRPDGYWIFKTENPEKPRVIALEVERTTKKAGDYKPVGEFYENEDRIDSVIWIIESEALARKLDCEFKIKYANTYEHPPKMHAFIRLRDFCKSGWQAKIFVGKNTGQDLESFLTNASGNTSATPPQHSNSACCVPLILDQAIKRRKSQVSDFIKNGREVK